MPGVCSRTGCTEFETVASAFYIDPSDQSAWIYHRWLLGRVENPPRLSHVLARLDGSELELAVVLTQPAHLVPDKLAVTWQGRPCEGTWGNGAGAAGNEISSCPCAIWTMRATLAVQGDSGTAAASAVNLDFPLGSVLTSSRTPTEACSVSVHVDSASGAHTAIYGEDVRRCLARYILPSSDLLAQQLAVIRELVDELDEGQQRKWAYLAIVYILNGLDASAHRAEITDTITR